MFTRDLPNVGVLWFLAALAASGRRWAATAA
jgi:hypothetical protein